MMPGLDTRLDWDAINGQQEHQAATCPPDPKARLSALLTSWAGMDESQWTQEAVDQLKDQILDLFRDYPDQADAWFRAWRALHPEARLA
jgi:hypothetical protein